MTKIPGIRLIPSLLGAETCAHVVEKSTQMFRSIQKSRTSWHHAQIRQRHHELVQVGPCTARYLRPGQQHDSSSADFIGLRNIPFFVKDKVLPIVQDTSEVKDLPKPLDWNCTLAAGAVLGSPLGPQNNEVMAVINLVSSEKFRLSSSHETQHSDANWELPPGSLILFDGKKSAQGLQGLLPYQSNPANSQKISLILRCHSKHFSRYCQS